MGPPRWNVNLPVPELVGIASFAWIVFAKDFEDAEAWMDGAGLDLDL